MDQICFMNDTCSCALEPLCIAVSSSHLAEHLKLKLLGEWGGSMALSERLFSDSPMLSVPPVLESFLACAIVTIV